MKGWGRRSRLADVARTALPPTRVESLCVIASPQAVLPAYHRGSRSASAPALFGLHSTTCRCGSRDYVSLGGLVRAGADCDLSIPRVLRPRDLDLMPGLVSGSRVSAYHWLAGGGGGDLPSWLS